MEEAGNQKEITCLRRCLASPRKSKPENGACHEVYERAASLHQTGVKCTRPSYGTQGSRLCASQHRNQCMTDALVQNVCKRSRQKADRADSERIVFDGIICNELSAMYRNHDGINAATLPPLQPSPSKPRWPSQ